MLNPTVQQPCLSWRVCLPPSPKVEPKEPPQSTGRIYLLADGRFGSRSPRDCNGHRKIIGTHGSLSEAQAAICNHMKGAK
ncbi:MAG: hypothetical protein V4529_16560 [Gemmatimonadota bacterium]